MTFVSDQLIIKQAPTLGLTEYFVEGGIDENYPFDLENLHNIYGDMDGETPDIINSGLATADNSVPGIDMPKSGCYENPVPCIRRLSSMSSGTADESSCSGGFDSPKTPLDELPCVTPMSESPDLANTDCGASEFTYVSPRDVFAPIPAANSNLDLFPDMPPASEPVKDIAEEIIASLGAELKNGKSGGVAAPAVKEIPPIIECASPPPSTNRNRGQKRKTNYDLANEEGKPLKFADDAAEKRYRNTLAARRSRAKKVKLVEDLERRLGILEQERDWWKSLYNDLKRSSASIVKHDDNN